MRSVLVALTFVALLFLSGCCKDPNDHPTFGEKSGAPKNCRAIIQANIDGWKNGAYTAAEAMDSMERNCGTYGTSWGQ